MFISFACSTATSIWLLELKSQLAEFDSTNVVKSTCKKYPYSYVSKYISKIESSTNRALSIASVLQLCDALSVSPSFLLLGTNDNNPNAGYDDVAQKLKLCDTEQLRYVSKFIDAITGD